MKIGDEKDNVMAVAKFIFITAIQKKICIKTKLIPLKKHKKRNFFEISLKISDKSFVMNNKNTTGNNAKKFLKKAN